MYTVLVVLALGAVGSTLGEGTCNPGGIRKDCGYGGIGPERCEDKGCCWNTETIGVPWCFHAEEEEVEVDPCADLTGWTKVVSFDTAEGDECPDSFKAYFSGGESQTEIKGCGMPPSTEALCSSVVYPVTVPYTQVCGRTRGYQLWFPEGFEVTRYKSPDERTIDQIYVDGVSITQGSSPRRHIWTNAANFAETFRADYVCPCAHPDEYDYDLIPDFVGEDYYCEAGRVTIMSEAGEGDLWDDPLWDGEGCKTEGNKCCERFGWFHRTVEESSDPIEVRVCDDHAVHVHNSVSNTVLDQVEIYVK